MKKTKVKQKKGRPFSGREIKETYTARVRPSKVNQIRNEYGSFQLFIDICVDAVEKGTK
jgi:hypothetical protein